MQRPQCRPFFGFFVSCKDDNILYKQIFHTDKPFPFVFVGSLGFLAVFGTIDDKDLNKRETFSYLPVRHARRHHPTGPLSKLENKVNVSSNFMYRWSIPSGRL